MFERAILAQFQRKLKKEKYDSSQANSQNTENQQSTAGEINPINWKNAHKRWRQINAWEMIHLDDLS